MTERRGAPSSQKPVSQKSPRIDRKPLAVALWLAVLALPVGAQIPVEAFQLDNGMTFLLVRRPGLPMTAAGWAAHIGSHADPLGKSGMSHLIEHLMFNGSRSIGSRSIERELELMVRQEERRREIGRLVAAQAGEEARQRLAKLRTELDRLAAEQRSLMKKGEYALIYTEAGAIGMNALTREDMTLYYVQVPASKLELWFWMESDRLLHPVFRDFYAEFDTIAEERRQRIDANPGARERASFVRQFWGDAHPYAVPVIGYENELAKITRPEAEAHYRAHYGAGNLTAVLVGDFDSQQVRELAVKYFGRLPAAQEATVPPGTIVAMGRDTPTDAMELRMEASCICPAQVEIRYRTVPFGDPDSYPLEVLAGILNGRTGRLHRRLVLDRQIAFSASAQSSSLEHAGSFSLYAEGLGSSTPAELEAALEGELVRLREELPAARELEKTKNRIVTDASRQLRSPLAMMVRLLLYAGLGDWRHLERGPGRLDRVTAQDVRRVVRSYFRPSNRGVLLLNRDTEGDARSSGNAG